MKRPVIKSHMFSDAFESYSPVAYIMNVRHAGRHPNAPGHPCYCGLAILDDRQHSGASFASCVMQLFSKPDLKVEISHVTTV